MAGFRARINKRPFFVVFTFNYRISLSSGLDETTFFESYVKKLTIDMFLFRFWTSEDKKCELKKVSHKFDSFTRQSWTWTKKIFIDPEKLNFRILYLSKLYFHKRLRTPKISIPGNLHLAMRESVAQPYFFLAYGCRKCLCSFTQSNGIKENVSRIR